MFQSGKIMMARVETIMLKIIIKIMMVIIIKIMMVIIIKIMMVRVSSLRAAEVQLIVGAGAPAVKVFQHQKGEMIISHYNDN